jgi:hypothetical protein
LTHRFRERQAPDLDGVIEEIPLQDASAGMGNSWRDRALVVMAVIAVGGGLLIAGANAIGLTGENSDATRTSASAVASAGSSAPTQLPVGYQWQLTAEIHRNNVGDVFRYECPPGGVAGSIFGLGLYAASSSVCTAAVHWGSVSLQAGGTVTIQIKPGASTYPGVAANGVLSHGAGEGDASFMFVEENAVSGPWARGAVVHRGDIGQEFDYDCPAGGTPSLIWGTRVYTDDSSICTAAVHAGLITFARGGMVTIEIRPGRDSYRGSVSNHVVSSSWTKSDGSYVFAGNE